jgi:uncharacterized coiled-coil protein SlyX
MEYDTSGASVNMHPHQVKQRPAGIPSLAYLDTDLDPQQTIVAASLQRQIGELNNKYKALNGTVEGLSNNVTEHSATLDNYGGRLKVVEDNVEVLQETVANHAKIEQLINDNITNMVGLDVGLGPECENPVSSILTSIHFPLDFYRAKDSIST